MKRFFILFVIFLVISPLFCNDFNEAEVQILNSHEENINETSSLNNNESTDLNYKIAVLTEENTQLKNLIFESADITVNGENLHTNGLLKGCAIAWAKYKAIKDKTIKNGNLAEITSDDIVRYNNNTVMELNVETSLNHYICSNCGKIHSKDINCTGINITNTTDKKSTSLLIITIITIFLFSIIIIILINILLDKIDSIGNKLFYFDLENITFLNKNIKKLVEDFEAVDFNNIDVKIPYSIIDRFSNLEKNLNITKLILSKTPNNIILSSIPLEQLGFTYRTFNKLKNQNIVNLEQFINLSNLSKTELRNIFPPQTVREIIAKLKEYYVELKN